MYSCILIIEILFIIFSTYYLISKKTISNNKRNLLYIGYVFIIVIFNIAILNNFIDKIDVGLYKDKIYDLKLEISKYNTELDKLFGVANDNEIIILKKELDDIKYANSILIESINNLQSKKNILSKKLDSLKGNYEKLEKQSSFIITDFPTYQQFPNYPNGCESVSLYLMLKYYGIDVTVEEIVEKLKKGDAPYRKKGVLYGGDPEVEFVGDPRLKSGYGVFQKPIIDVANYYKKGIIDLTGTSLSDVLEKVSKGKPVQVWASINLKNTYICAKWLSTSTNRYVEWKCGLHSLIIIGYTYDNIVTSDPYTGKIEYYKKSQFEKMYNEYGKRAIYYEK